MLPPTATEAPCTVRMPEWRIVPAPASRSRLPVIVTGPGELSVSERPWVQAFVPVPGPVPSTSHVSTLALGPK